MAGSGAGCAVPVSREALLTELRACLLVFDSLWPADSETRANINERIERLRELVGERELSI